MHRVPLLAPLLAWSVACSTPGPTPSAVDAGSGGPAPPSIVELGADPVGPAPAGLIAVVVPRRQIAVAPPASGAIAEVRVALGDRVEAGDVVARLDDHALAAALEEARGALRAARADARRSAVDLRQARSRARRRDQLVADGVIAAEEAEDARFEAARGKAARAVAESSVDRAGAIVAQLERDLAAAAMTAPFAGRIATIHHVAGAQVGAGEPVVTIVSDDAIVRFAAPPARASSVVIGAPVVFVAGDASIPGRIVSVAPALDRAAEMLFAECELQLEGAARPALRTVGRIELGTVAASAATP